MDEYFKKGGNNSQNDDNSRSMTAHFNNKLCTCGVLIFFWVVSDRIQRSTTSFNVKSPNEPMLSGGCQVPAEMGLPCFKPDY